jgi:hypothetical protein
MSEPRQLFKPESPLAGLAPGAQAAAAAGLLSSHLLDLRKLPHALDLAAVVAELEFQLSRLLDAEVIFGRANLIGQGVNFDLAETRMRNCLKIARAIHDCLKATEAIDLGIVNIRPADDQKARRLEYLLECGREDLARAEGLL